IHTSFRQIPFLIPLPWGCTSAEPAASIIRLLEGVAGPEGTNLSFATGFPLADTEHGGPSVYGCGPDPAAVEAAVERLAAEVAAREAQWTGRLHDPEAAVAEAVQRAGAATGPVVLADVQDDPGSGGTGDTMNLLK